nr:MAG: GHMP kinase [Pseudomonadota bacterium]
MTRLDERGERDRFVERVRSLVGRDGPLFGLFHPQGPIGVARAPGRLDVMGGIADYSGSLVLELPLSEAAFAAAQLHDEPFVRVVSLDGEHGPPSRDVVLPGPAVLEADYAEAKRLFHADPDNAWAAYIGGVAVALARERGLAARGVRLLVASRVPEGRGVSSSAAIEAAALFALAAAAGIELAEMEAANLCQKVENLVVGAPCGVMDQMTAICGRNGRLLELVCQPARVLGSIEIPEDLAFFGIDSAVRHHVTGDAYRDVRIAAFMGYRMLTARAGMTARRTGDRHVAIDDTRWGGYLANVTPSELALTLGERLPERMTGAEFLARYTGTSDLLTEIDPARTYPVRAATEHPIHEHHRVQLFAELLQRSASERRNRLLGELMVASHLGYSACGLGSPATDRIVRLVHDAGPRAGLYGAKITGGGSGGTVAVLARREAEVAVREVAYQYAVETDHEPRVFAGSSAGAAEVGALLIPGDQIVPVDA